MAKPKGIKMDFDRVGALPGRAGEGWATEVSAVDSDVVPTLRPETDFSGSPTSRRTGLHLSGLMIIIIVIAVVLGAGGLAAGATTPREHPRARALTGSPPNPYAYLPRVPSFRLTSTSVRNGRPLPAAQLYTSAGGQNISPQLSWSGFPAHTKSFVVSMYDPEAPTGSGFWQWVVTDIPARVTSLPADAGARSHRRLPKGAVPLLGDAGLREYVGGAPAPGTGVHDYYITVTALNEAQTDVPRTISAAYLGEKIARHTIARATIICPTPAPR